MTWTMLRGCSVRAAIRAPVCYILCAGWKSKAPETHVPCPVG